MALPMRWSALLAQSVLLAAVASWPLLRAPWTAAIGAPEGDVPKHLWTLWWMRAEALGGLPGPQTALVNAPAGATLFPIEPLHGLAALLLPLPPVPLSNLLAFGHLVAFGLATGALAFALTRRAAGAHLAAALAQTSAIAGAALHFGVGELRMLWVLPVGLLLAHRARDGRRWAPFLGLGLFLGLAVATSFYLGFFLGVALLAWGLCWVPARPRLLPRLAVAAALALAVALPPARAFDASYAPAAGRPATLAARWAGPFPPAGPASHSLDLTDPLRPARAGALRGDARQARTYAGGRYLGPALLALAALGAWGARRRALPWLAVALAGAVLALGEVPRLDGQLLLDPARAVLPYAWLNKALDALAEPMNFPVRFWVLPTLAAALLAAFAVRRPLAWALAPFALLGPLRHDAVPWPRATYTPDAVDLGARPAPAAGVDPRPGAWADLSLLGRRSGADPAAASLADRLDPTHRRRAATLQIAVDAPVSSVPIERIDAWFPEGLAWAAALPLAGAAEAGAPADPADVTASAILLHDAGFTHVFVTKAPGPGGAGGAGDTLRAAFGPPADLGPAWVWAVPAVAVDPAALPALRADHARRAKALRRGR